MLVARDVGVSVGDDVLILESVSLEVAPGALVALMGGSGSGKSTLLRVLAGITEPSAGLAVWASEPTSSAVHELGYVPQRESVHDWLTTREALHYAACLRLSADAPIEGRVTAVLQELDLVAQADTLIRHLSGGERRRAGCGLELVGDPAVLLLDEPTSGLDAVLERRLMQLFRRLADQGRAVLVATHATASLDLCDEVVTLEAGVNTYRGSSSQARARLASVTQDLRQSAGAESADFPPDLERVAAQVRRPDAVSRSADGFTEAGLVPLTVRRPFGRELRTLASRYARTLMRDRRTLVLLVGQAPLIGLLIAIVFSSAALSTNASPVAAIELVFLLMTGAIWLGVTSACREIVKERGLVEREFDVGVRLDAYVLAKALVLFALNIVQVLLLALVVLSLRPLDAGSGGAVQMVVIAVLTAWASTVMGLVVSCIARSVDQASGAVPLLLMPQLLLAGGLIPLAQMPGFVAALTNLVYARWSFAGLASAGGIGERLSQYDYSSALGFSNGFFAMKPTSAALILIAYILVGLLAAVFALTRRPPVTP